MPRIARVLGLGLIPALRSPLTGVSGPYSESPPASPVTGLVTNRPRRGWCRRRTLSHMSSRTEHDVTVQNAHTRAACAAHSDHP
jgi:hypothetical protein